MATPTIGQESFLTAAIQAGVTPPDCIGVTIKAHFDELATIDFKCIRNGRFFGLPVETWCFENPPPDDILQQLPPLTREIVVGKTYDGKETLTYRCWLSHESFDAIASWLVKAST